MATTLSGDDIEITEDFLTDHIREITSEEVATYNEQGWVALQSFLSPELAALILERIKLAADYVEGKGFTSAWTDLDDRGTTRTAWYSTHTGQRDADVLGRIARSTHLARQHAKLIGADRLRLWSDSTNVKPPGGEATGWHQDMQAFPWAPPSGGGLWTALVEMPPEMAPLQYLTGSHRSEWEEPGRGDPEDRSIENLFRSGGPTRDEALERWPIAPPLHLYPGDTLAHHALMFHGTEGPNRGSEIRWAWVSQRFPADATFVDKHNVRSNGLGLVEGEPLDHPEFPIVCE